MQEPTTRDLGQPSAPEHGKDAVCFSSGPEAAVFGAGTVHAYLAADRPPPVVAAGISSGALAAAVFHKCYKELRRARTDREAARWGWLRRYLSFLSNQPLDAFWDGLPDQSDFFADFSPIADPSLPDHLEEQEKEALDRRYRLVQFGRWLARLPVPFSRLAGLVVAHVRRKENYPSPWLGRMLAFIVSVSLLGLNLVWHVARAPQFYRRVLTRADRQPAEKGRLRWVRTVGKRLLLFARRPRPLFGYSVWLSAVTLVGAAAILLLGITVLLLPGLDLATPWMTEAARISQQLRTRTWAAIGVAGGVLVACAILVCTLHGPLLRRISAGVGLDRSLIHDFHLRRRLRALFEFTGDDDKPRRDLIPRTDTNEYPHPILVAAPLQTVYRTRQGQSEPIAAPQLWAQPDKTLADSLVTALALPGIFTPELVKKEPPKEEGPRSFGRADIDPRDMQVLDGAVVAANPMPAMFRYLREHEKLAAKLAPPDQGAAVHVVYSVPKDERPPGHWELADEATNVVDVARAALRLSRRCDIQTEVHQTNFLSELAELTGAAGSDDRTIRVKADEIAPENEAKPLELRWNRETVLKFVASGCRRTLETLYQQELAMRNGGSESPCQDLLLQISPRRRATISSRGPGLPEVCASCSGRLRPADPGSNPLAPRETADQLANEFPQLTRAEPASPRIVVAASGGVFRGVFQAGMVAALWRAGVRPDMVVGASVGTLMSGVLAAISQHPPAPPNSGPSATVDEGLARERLRKLVDTLVHVDHRIALTRTLKASARELGLRGRSIKLSAAAVRRAVLRGSRADAGFAATGAPPALIDAIAVMFMLPHEQTISIARKFLAGQVFAAFRRFLEQVKRHTLRRLSIEQALLGADLIEGAARDLLGGPGFDLGKRQPYQHAVPGRPVAFFASAVDLGKESLFFLGMPERRQDLPYDFVEGTLASSAFPAVFAPRRQSDLVPGLGNPRVRLSDGGMFDNLPLLPALQVLAKAQSAGGRSPAQALGRLEDRRRYPDLILAAALNVNPERDRSKAGERICEDMLQIMKRARSLRDNAKLRGFERLAVRTDQLIGQIVDHFRGPGAGKLKHHFQFLEEVVDAAVLPVFPVDREHLNPTFAFCRSLGLKRKRLMRSVAHGCFQTLAALSSNPANDPNSLEERAKAGLRARGRLPVIQKSPTRSAAPGECPYFLMTPATDGRSAPVQDPGWFSCAFAQPDEPRSNGQQIHVLCTRDKLHRELWRAGAAGERAVPISNPAPERKERAAAE
jgi:predicted acylesterase/phospholipase RssA